MLPPPAIPSFLPCFLLFTLLQHLFHNFLFLNQERPHNPVSDTICTSGPSVGTRHGLLRLRHCGELSWSGSRQAGELDLAVTAFGRRALLLRM